MNNNPYAHSNRVSVGFSHSEIRECSTSELPENPVVAMAYVPFQTDTTIYDEMKALKRGTLYPVLDKPFKGRVVR